MLAKRAAATFDELAEAVAGRLALNRRVRRNLPGNGRVRIDRQLPFLCVYREPADRSDAGTRELVTTEAAYLFATRGAEHHTGLSRLCRRIAATLTEHFGAFLFVEIWSDELDGAEKDDSPSGVPAFQIVTGDAHAMPTMVDRLREGLEHIHVRRHAPIVNVVKRSVVAPPGLPPLIESDCTEAHCVYVGLAVRPIYRDPATGSLYPMVLQRLRQQLAPALRKSFAAFAGIGKNDSGPHYETFGPTTLVRAVQAVDEQLCEVTDAFNFVYQVTPINVEEAWRRFAARDYASSPTFWYRPLPYDPSLLKRKLYEAPIERLEDTTLAHLFSEKQVELDRQISALRDMETSHFLYNSIQLYGSPNGDLAALAERLLEETPPNEPSPSDMSADDGVAGASEVAARAKDEIEAYRADFEGFDAQVEIRGDIASGMMVTGNKLLIASTVEIPRHRLASLVHHEVGVHLLTYFNGRAQPFGQFHAGLAGYEFLQEGLAVLAEYLAGGLTQNRLRQLAARVIAVDAVCRGADFVETFRRLHGQWDMPARSAFRATARVFRGGGLTKDLVYLQGIRDLLHYLGEGHDLEPLFVGKIALEHTPFVQELRRRNVIRAPVLLPRFLKSEKARQKLEQLRSAEFVDLYGVFA